MRLFRYCALMLACASVFASAAGAGTPIVLSHQGYLLDATDKPVTGARDLTFKIYEASSGGTPLWSETLPAVSIQNGLFSVSLGSITPIDPNVLTGAGSPPTERYLEITVGGVVLTPRQRLGSAAYAALSHRVDGDVVTSPGQLTVSHPGSTSSATLTATADGASSVIGGDLDGDGVPDDFVSSSITPTSSNHAINTKGAGSNAGRTMSVSSTTDQTSAKHAINTKGTGTAGRSVLSSTDATEAVHVVAADLDGDGLADRSVWQKVDNTEASSEVSADLDHDGKPDVGTSSSATATRSELKGYFQTGDIPTQSQFSTLIDSKVANSGLGVSYTGQWTSSSSTMCSEDSTVHEVSFSGPPGPLGTAALMKAKEKANRTKCSNNLRCIAGNGASTETDLSCDSSSARMLMSGATSLSGSSGSKQLTVSPDSISDVSQVGTAMEWSIHRAEHGKGGVSRLAQHHSAVKETNVDEDCDGISARTKWEGRSGSTTGTIRMTAAHDNALSSLETDSDGDGIPEASVTWQVDATGPTVRLGGHTGSTTGTIRMSATPDSTVFDLGYSGSTTGTIRMQSGIPGGHPIELSGGAYCDGANWVNASDATLKENFQPVDGQQLLDKIAQLPVSEWNYKSQDDGQKHIGPTAQDFRKVFGVGSDGKSISTIDPSGIALAAIKELDKQNRELKDQNAELKRQLDDLKKAVEELRATK